ncbi:MAG: beta-glucosidase [Anaerolineales bacterium]|nr:beta-glucosidase [Anaerolineales bacterium]
MSKFQFPKEFTWGVATSSYQIEGAWNEDGKGESIWDRFCHSPGNIDNGDTGDVACDHYHRWPEDVALMKTLGVHAYRLSLSWPRVLPEGRGRINHAGLDFYNRLIDGLLDAGIQPFITLYHWDLPQALQDEGGWTVRSTADAFTEYADLVSRHLGDRVNAWMTLNEPFVSAYVGYFEGRHAPGHASLDEMMSAAHHLMLAHGMAIPIIRRNSDGAEVGIVLNLGFTVPASPSEADMVATKRSDGIVNRWYLDPLNGKGYPTDITELFARPMEYVQSGDLETIATPIDFLGVNYYFRSIVRSEEIPEEENAPRTVFSNPDLTEMGWEVYPEGLFEILTRVHREYSFPALYVTENGAAYVDRVDENGEVHDPKRIAYLQGHLLAIAKAIKAGVPLKGYFAWSLMDNFEWAHGFSKRFGLIYVDFSTQRRILKSSARWYQGVISANAIEDV